MEAWSDAAGVAIVATERPSSAAFRLWSRTPATVFVLQRGAPAATLAFLREFNSYFDLIVCADEGQWLALHRYVWDARVLRLRDEVGASVALEVDADAKALRPPPGPRVISESV